VNPLEGAIDTHIHSAPDTVPRAQDDIDLARTAAAAGMRAIVLKSHHFCTADRAILAGKSASITVFGGLVLNATSCGGINPEAVRVTLQIGGRFVWLPTVSAVNHLNYVRRNGVSAHVRSLTHSDVSVQVLDSRGRVGSPLESVLKLIAAHDAVLATGHISVEETRLVVRRALELGVKRIVVTHPEAPLVAMPVDLQRELAADGVLFERCYLSVVDGMSAADLLATIRAVGVKSTVLATDFGQAAMALPTDAFRAYYDELRKVGMTDDEWHVMACANARSLLGIGNQGDNVHD
jgi:hypothetical protein